MKKLTRRDFIKTSAATVAALSACPFPVRAQKAGRTYIDMGLFRKNTASVVSWCKFNPSDSVMAAIERAVGQKK